MEKNDPYSQFKAAQKVGWGLFFPLETITIPAAAKLVDFAEVKPGHRVLDCACGTGVVAITAALRGAQVKGLDLAPALLKHAQQNSELARTDIEFTEGDVEALPFADSSFDLVLSQFGHMFAPRPEVAVKEMLRVLKPGGRIAFSTWPPDHFIGALFNLVAQYLPLPAGIPPSASWGEPAVIKERLAGMTKDLVFDRSYIRMSALSVPHARDVFERTSAPVIKLMSDFKDDTKKIAQFRSELDALLSRYISGNILRKHYLLSRATKI